MLVAVGAIAGTAAGCGSSGKSPGSSPGRAHFLAFSQCMRADGVPSFPDPSAGGGINLDGTGVNPAAPAFQAAQKSCQKLLPGGGPGGRHASAQDKAQMLQISQCMRAHGVSGFPDPKVMSSPPADPSAYSLLQDRGGIVLAVPSTIDVNSPVFVKAAKACQFR